MTWRRRHDTPEDHQPPVWPGDTQASTRVLVEHAEPAAREMIVRGLRERGYEVVSCGGPHGHGDTGTEGCPVLHGERCPGVDGADVIVSSLNLTRQQERTIVRTIADDPTSPPVHIEASDWQLANALGPGAHVSHNYPFASVEQIATAIEELSATPS